MGAVPTAPPYRKWWDATDDGRVYEGWEQTRAELRSLLEGLATTSSAIGVLGFSQGAMVAATVAALSVAGQLPPVRFAILVAGMAPRADVLRPLFAQPLPMPSLHVWGDRDYFTGPGGPALVQQFAADRRQACVWPGPHVIPTRGPGADALRAFVRAQLDAIAGTGTDDRRVQLS